jgi:hypothetical protein
MTSRGKALIQLSSAIGKNDGTLFGDWSTYKISKLNVFAFRSHKLALLK